VIGMSQKLAICAVGCQSLKVLHLQRLVSWPWGCCYSNRDGKVYEFHLFLLNIILRCQKEATSFAGDFY